MLANGRVRRAYTHNGLHQRLREQVPADVRDRLTHDQLTRLVEAVMPQQTNHGLALKATFRWITGRFYIAIIGGRERRSDNRLRAEGQTIVPVGMSVFIFLALLAIYGAFPLALLLYLLKSALRIDFFEGPSPMHTWLCG